MAKKKTRKNGGVNKSQAIRAALAKNPNASPKELSAALTSQGIDVTPAFVSMIKFKMNSQGKPAAKRAASRQEAGNLNVDGLIEAKKLADRVGGIENAQSLLQTLKKLL